MMRYKERPESFEKDDYKYHRLLKYALIFLTVYVITLSLLPLLHTLLNKSGFVVIGLSPYTLDAFTSNGWGGYSYTSDKYQVVFSDATRGENKPKIFIYTYSLPSFLMELVEFSDKGSSINSIPIADAKLKTNLTSKDMLIQTYNFTDFFVNKTTKVNENEIKIAYNSTKPVDYKFTLWRWYYKDVNGINASSFKGSNSVVLRNITNFTFDFEGKMKGTGNVTLSQKSNLTIERDELGINKLTLTSRAQNISIQITGDLADVKVSPVVVLVSNVLTNKFVLLIFPLVTAVILFLAWRRWGR